jgi:hypothetical protein
VESPALVSILDSLTPGSCDTRCAKQLILPRETPGSHLISAAVPEYRRRTLVDLPLEIRQQIYRSLLRRIVSSPASYPAEHTCPLTGPFIFTVEQVIPGRHGETSLMTFNSITNLRRWDDMRPPASAPSIPYVVDLVTSLTPTNTAYTIRSGGLTKIIPRPLWPVPGGRFPTFHSDGMPDAVYRCRLGVDQYLHYQPRVLAAKVFCRLTAFTVTH